MSLPNPVRLRRELIAATHIPYTAQVSPTVVRTRTGDYVQTLRIAGASFDSVDEETLNNWHERLNVLWRNVASPHVALWSHLIRRRETAYPGGQFTPGFAHDLNDKYRRRIAGHSLMVNELYLSLVYRPHAAGAEALTAKAFGRRTQQQRDSGAALEDCAKLRELLVSALERYEPRPLAVVVEAGRTRSQLLEFFGYLINGEAQRFAFPRAPINQILATTRLLFGREAIEYRKPSSTQFAAMLAIKEYASLTSPGVLNACLAAPFPLVLTQSFTFLTRAAGQGLLQRQQHQMRNAGDLSVSQADELQTALDQLTSNHFAFGEHHCSLQVFSDDASNPDATRIRQQLAVLNDRIAHARSLMVDTGMVVAREDLGLEAAFWSQLPGNFALRPRRAAITTRNFAAFVPFLNYPAGRATGNPWGDALTQFVTPARSPFFFSLHATDAKGQGPEASDAAGHTFLSGPTGSGKTVLIGFLIAMLVKQGVTQVIFDKDRGLEILIRALGGTYEPLRSGEPTGFNPLRLEPTASNREFLTGWLLSLIGGAPLTAAQSADLDQALSGTLSLDPTSRRLSRLIEFLDPTDAEGLHARLLPWCEAGGGDRAWVFDHADDAVVERIHASALIGFDVTQFLDNPTIRTPITLYLFHLVRQRLDGRRFVCWLDEFWRMLGDPSFAHFAKDGPKTWRKLNAVMCLSTQSPSDVLQSPIARTIIEQTPTKIFFPNGQATRADYCDGFAVSEREWQQIREHMEPGSHRFLVKQGAHSVICELDLQGFEAELAVISARPQTVNLMYELIADHGTDPAHWLPAFRAAIARPLSPPQQRSERP
jgi:type IV secretion system protein VirB4